MVARDLREKGHPGEQGPGEDNCADLMTKHLSAKVIHKNVIKMHMKFEAGRAAKAAALHAVSIPIENPCREKDPLNSFEVGRQSVERPTASEGETYGQRFEWGVASLAHVPTRRLLHAV